MTKIPKYEVIKNDLIRTISEGVYPPGSELPSENDLIDKYNVSRITIRRAIDELYLADYIEKKQGKRAIVRGDIKTQELTSISSYTEEILRQGMVPSRKVLSSMLRLCQEEEQKLLQLDKAEPVYTLCRVVYADDKPLCYTDTALPYKYFRDIEQNDFSIHSLYDIIENTYGIKITTSELKLRAVLATEEISHFLGIEKGTPLLHYSAVTYGIVDGKELPIEHFITYYLTDLFEYSLIQKRR